MEEDHAANTGDGDSEPGDAHRLSATDLKIYARAGLTPAEAQAWADAGFPPYRTGLFREAGSDLPTAIRLRELGMDYRHLRLARDTNLSFEDVMPLAALVKESDAAWKRIAAARRLGLSISDIADHPSLLALSQTLALLRLGVPLELIKSWLAAGFDLAACRGVLRDGYDPLDMEAQLRWKQAFPDLTRRRAWQTTGLGADAAETAAKLDYRPIDILDGGIIEEQPPKLPKRQVVVVQPGAHLVLPDGEELHPEIRRMLTGVGVSKTLKAFGYSVIVSTPRKRFLEEHADDILISLRSKRRTAAAALGQLEVGVTVATDFDEESSRTSEEFRDLHAALDALATEARAGSFVVTAVSARTVDATDLLALVQPLAPLFAEGATINRLGVVGFSAGKDHWVLPSDPPAWPRYAADEDGPNVAVGPLVLRTVPALEPVGWFTDPATGFASARATAPLLIVERTTADGETTRVQLVRTPEQLVLVDRRGRRRPLGTSDPLEAIRATSALRDVRPREATAFFSSVDGPTTQELVPLLRVRRPDLLLSEEPVQFPSSYNPWAGSAEESSPISERALLINDEPWVIVLPSSDRSPLLCPQDPQIEIDSQLSPQFLEPWAAFEISNLGEGRIGLLADDTIGEFEYDYGEPERLEVRPRTEISEEVEIARWLQSLCSEWCVPDVILLAAEVYANAPDGFDFPNELIPDLDYWDHHMTAKLTISGDVGAVLRALHDPATARAVERVREFSCQRGSINSPEGR